MLVPALLGRPHERVLVLEEAQVIIEIDPCRAGLLEHRAMVQAVRIDEHELQVLLVAALALEHERARVGQPVHARKINVAVPAGILAVGTGLAEIHPAHARIARPHQPEPDRDIRPSRGRIALRHRFGAIGVDLGALDLVDAGFVVVLERDQRIVRRPPVAGRAIHLLLRDELGLAVVHGTLAVARQLVVEAGLKIDRVEILLADERHVAAFRRDLRIDHVEPGRRQAAQLRAGLRVEIVEPQPLADAEQDLAAVRRPAVRDDAAQLRDALALAAGLLGVGKLRRRTQRCRIDEPARRAAGDVEGPEIELVLVAVAALEERDAAAVRRDLERARARPVDVGIGVDPLDRQFRGHGGRADRNRGGAEQDAHENLPSMRGLSLRACARGNAESASPISIRQRRSMPGSDFGSSVRRPGRTETAAPRRSSSVPGD